ncbi:MAG TPA: PqqD family protein [Melioribacteraceae bacterium]|nr:PqqD family protein [Melioribacteraceae bacterium]
MEELLSLYPVRLCEYELSNDIVVIHYIDKNPSFIEKIFFRKNLNKPFKIDLDEIGSFIYPLCDGTKSINEIINLGKEKFAEKIEPAENRVTQFMKQLHSKKLVELYRKVEKK